MKLFTKVNLIVVLICIAAVLIPLWWRLRIPEPISVAYVHSQTIIVPSPTANPKWWGAVMRSQNPRTGAWGGPVNIYDFTLAYQVVGSYAPTFLQPGDYVIYSWNIWFWIPAQPVSKTIIIHDVREYGEHQHGIYFGQKGMR